MKLKRELYPTDPTESYSFYLPSLDWAMSYGCEDWCPNCHRAISRFTIRNEEDTLFRVGVCLPLLPVKLSERASNALRKRFEDFFYFCDPACYFEFHPGKISEREQDETTKVWLERLEAFYSNVES